MLNKFQNWTIFVLFCAFSTALIVLEGSIIWRIFNEGISIEKSVAAFLSTSVLSGCGVVFKKLVEANFLDKEVLPMPRLQQYASKRNKTIKESEGSGVDEYETRRLLITATLELAEKTLSQWIPGSHIELCVFVDQKCPLLFSYFDSNLDTSSRSMSIRKTDPHFYIQSKYAVTDLLLEPTSHIKIINDTSAVEKYEFATDVQKSQLRSTLLICLDIESPCVLVITSNETNAFLEQDKKLMSFVRFIAQTVRYDLFDRDFINRIRDLKPQLFDVEIVQLSNELQEICSD